MLQTSRFQVSRKKLQVISIALKFARFVVLEINSSKHNIHVICFCYKFWNSRHSQLLQMSNVSSWFFRFKKKEKEKISYFINSWRWRHWWGVPGVWYRQWISLDMIHTPTAFITYRPTLSGGCHYTHLESGRNIRYDRIFVQISDLVDKYFQDHCTITTI